MTVVQVVERDVIPTGEYPVKVDKVEEEEGQFGPQLRWTLEIIGNSEYAGKTFSAWTSQSGGMKSKLIGWATACGLELEPGDELDTNDLYGKKAMAVILVEVKKSDGSEYNKVETLKAPKKNKPTPAPAQTSGEDDPFLNQ